MTITNWFPWRDAAMDIRCGPGTLAAAGARLADVPGATVRQCGFAEFASTADAGGADLITMVAVLHWLDLDDTLTRIPALLAPGGRFLVVGLARPDSLADFAVDVVSSVANPVMGMIKHPRPVRPSPRDPDRRPGLPVQDPVTTFAGIRAAAKAQLPGAAVRRRLFFRYTLRWDKPAALRATLGD